ncbi:putative Small nuclear ribonucleoprotein F [Giardia muris]|uniref:Putative Small nuclear ribonucleoprotein F n=1 Tax=Giardia muris TaxID=5742 RepID=A0A4Z1T5I0_GIAMU|nr:putative Small nuclear ribonucleoprotein F [Giardia muris]|eukprot:TNJ27731.1 putative Small nuclear ribonucleoprotein F [Giardia muris]
MTPVEGESKQLCPIRTLSGTAMQTRIMTPNAFWLASLGKEVSLRLRCGLRLRGVLAAYDSYHNLFLKACSNSTGPTDAPLGDAFVRCTSIAYVMPLAR